MNNEWLCNVCKNSNSPQEKRCGYCRSAKPLYKYNANADQKMRAQQEKIRKEKEEKAKKEKEEKARKEKAAQLMTKQTRQGVQ